MQIKYDGDFSPVIGMRTYLETFITDDANDPDGQGGVQSLIIGEYGCGKSTLMLQMAQQAQYVVRGSKQGYIHGIVHNSPKNNHKTKPATVIWRIRDADGWPTLLPGNWISQNQGKPVKVFVHKDDINKITFFRFDQDHQHTPIPNLKEIATYDVSDDIVDQLLEGGINCVLEPQQYRLSPGLCNILLQSRAEYVGKSPNDTDKDDLEELPTKGRGRPLKVKDYSLHAVKPAVFWFDMINSLMTRWGGRPVTVILDEADDFLSQISSDAHWWLISAYTSWARDFRKLNISVVVSCHGWGLLHDLIYKRANVKLMMRGTKKSENTMIRYTRIFARLDRGMMISEKTNVEFGIAIFRKVEKTIMCRIDGLAGASRFFNDEIAKKIRSSYNLNPQQAKTNSAQLVSEA